MTRPDPAPEPAGFALPFAIAVLVAMSLVVAMLIDGAIASFRSAGAELNSARAAGVAETALAAALETRLDTTALAMPRGSVLLSRVTVGADSVATTVHLLAPPLVRIVVTVRAAAPGVRVSVGRLAVGALRADSESPGTLRIIPVGPMWWVPIP